MEIFYMRTIGYKSVNFTLVGVLGSSGTQPYYMIYVNNLQIMDCSDQN